MKYIDADKLIAEIERHILQEQGLEDGDAECGYKCALKDIKRFITSLQQEADYPRLLSLLLEAIDYSFMKTDKTYDTALTYPVIDKVNYIKKQLNNPCQQPEVDLEKEVDEWRDKNFDKKQDFILSGENATRKSQIKLAYYFYALGLNARKE